MKIIKNVLTFILLALAFTSLGAEYQWFNGKDHLFYRIDFENGNLFTANFKESWKFKEKIQLIDVQNFNLQQDFPRSQIELGESIYFFLGGTNRAFQYNFNEKYFRELKTSGQDGIDFGANFFKYRNKIYKIGGVGFWNVNNQLYEFDFQTNRWKYLQTEGQSSFGISDMFSYFDNKTGLLYSMDIFRFTLNPDEKEIALRTLNIKTKEWNEIGKVKNPILLQFFRKNADLVNNKIDNFHFLSGEPEWMYVMDFLNNQFYQYNGLEKHFYSDRFLGEYYESGKRKLVFCNLHQFDFSVNSYTVEFSDHSLRKYLKPLGILVEKEPLIDLNILIHPFIILLELFLIGIILFKAGIIFKKLSKPDIKNPEYENILQKILDLDKNEFSSEELNVIIKVVEKNPDTQRHYRSKFFVGFNRYIADQYKLEEVIKRKASERDKRYVTYSIDEKLIHYFKGINSNKFKP